MNHLAPFAASPALPALVAAGGERAGLRFLEFFAATIRDPHTRRAYSQAVGAFLLIRLGQSCTHLRELCSAPLAFHDVDIP